MRFGRRSKSEPRGTAPNWMFETRTEAWHEAGLGEELTAPDPRQAYKALGKCLVIGLLMAGVLVLFSHREALFSGADQIARIVTAVLLVMLGWSFARILGSGVAPIFLRRMDPGTAGTVGFIIRLGTTAILIFVALRIVGVKPATLAVGGAFTAVVLGLASQQTLGNLFAGIVLQGTRPFRVGERVRLQGGAVAGTIEGTVSTLGLFYTTLIKGADRIMIPNSVLLQLAVIPMREPDQVNLRARFNSSVRLEEIQRKLSEAITVPTRYAPHLEVEEVDRDEVVLRISATPLRPSDGSRLTEQILAVARRGGAVTEEHETAPSPAED